MKLRTGFVSNSSSSSFICIIPKNWTPSNEDIVAAGEDYIYEYDDDEVKSRDLFLNEVKDEIKKLKKGDYTLYSYDEHIKFATLRQLIPNEFVIQSWDSGPDDGRIMTPALEKIRNLL